MKKLYVFLISLFFLYPATAQQFGYDIEVKFKQPIQDETLLLGRYYCKVTNTLRFDSATRRSDGSYHFKSTDSFTGGIYWVLFNNNSQKVDFLLDNGSRFKILIDTTDLVRKSVFTGSKDNELMQQYHIDDLAFREMNNQALKDLEKAKTKADSSKVQERMIAARRELKEKYSALADAHEGSIFSLIIKALERPDPGPGPHYREDGKTIDSFYTYHYIKNHYWDNFPVWDNRLAFTPFYEEKLKDYFENFVYPVPDSLQKEADILLALSREAPDVFKYTLHWLAHHTRTKPIMGADESFVYLVENYYAKGDAFWLDTATLRKNYLEPAEDLSYTKLGKVGQDLTLHDAYTYTQRNLHSVDADYIILFFWEPDCGFCKKEIPALDSVYQALNLEKENVVIYSVPHDKSLENIHKAIDQLKIKKPYWLHNINMAGIRYDKLYALKARPTMFLLDKDKRILGKSINHAALEQLIKRDKEMKKSQ